MKRISLDDLLHTRQDLDYQEQYEYIMKLLEKGQIKPVKASKSNGKKPALYREYWMVEEQKDYSNYIEEIKYTFSTMISVDYYLAHPDTYEKDRIWVLMLNEYLKKHADALLTAESLNERSFEIWHREKFLDREQGKKILKRCGLNVEALNVYRTTAVSYTHLDVYKRQRIGCELAKNRMDSKKNRGRLLLPKKRTTKGKNVLRFI